MAVNKMFVMIPVMLAARKLDGEDPNIVFMLRCSYFTVQAIIFLLVVYIYLQASAFASKPENDKIVYVPPPPQPFADPNAKKKYTQTPYGAHVLTTARQLLVSTIFGIIITTGLHFYKGMIVGLAIQSIMGPLNIVESPLLQLFLLKKTEKVFEEKSRDELEQDAEIVDGSGNQVVLAPPSQAGSKAAIKKKEEGGDKNKKPLEDIMLDTWDEGEKANLEPLMEALNKTNVNYQTKTDDNGWTALMIVSGLGNGVKGVPSSLKQMKALGADATIVDNEGWNALHWTAFHGSAEAAKIILTSSQNGGLDGVNLGLHLVKDKEGKTAMDHAIAEKNDDVAEVITEATRNEQTRNDADSGGAVRRRN